MKGILDTTKISIGGKSMLSMILAIIIVIVSVLATAADLISFYFYSKNIIPYLQPILSIIFGVMLIISLSYILHLRTRYEIKRNRGESIKNISNIIEKEIINYIKKHKKIDIYDANLQTTAPGGILDADKKLAEICDAVNEDRTPRYTINWYIIVLKNEQKRSWIENLKSEIRNKNEGTRRTVKLYIIEGEHVSNFPLFNLFVIPDLNITFIGYGEYPGVDGGGILMRDKEIAKEMVRMINNWLQVSNEVE